MTMRHVDMEKVDGWLSSLVLFFCYQDSLFSPSDSSQLIDVVARKGNF